MDNLNSLLPYIRLHFNIENPDLEECYAFGYECAKAEISEDENPYNVNTLEYEQWQEGWWDGFYGEEPLYSLTISEDKLQDKQGRAEKAPMIDVTAANDQTYHPLYNSFIASLLRLSGALAATAVVGYQVIDLVA
ncbi:transmission trait enhancer LetE [Legionella sp. D16C41]|uniref:transmission trait enhancer LetE n=1 Tax=Legionella sp. D16C41 TaxID=3402688 RepID=UPI003AF9DC33